MNSLPPTPDRRRPAGTPPARLTRLATFVLLLAGGVVALLFAMRLTAAAFNCDFSPFRYLGMPSDPGVRAWLLLLAVVACGALVWLVVRDDEETLWLTSASGGVLVPAVPLRRATERAAARHPEVVRAEARLRTVGGGLGVVVRVYGRPLGDAARLAAEVEPLVRAGLAAATGADPVALVVRPRVLTVAQLKRYLP